MQNRFCTIIACENRFCTNLHTLRFLDNTYNEILDTSIVGVKVYNTRNDIQSKGEVLYEPTNQNP